MRAARLAVLAALVAGAGSAGADVSGDVWEGTWQVTGAIVGTLVLRPASDGATRAQAPPCEGGTVYRGAYAGSRTGTVSACVRGFRLVGRRVEEGRAVGGLSASWALELRADLTPGKATLGGVLTGVGAGSWLATWLRHGGELPAAATPTGPTSATRFRDARFGITFRYPNSFRRTTNPTFARNAGAEAAAKAGIYLTPDDLITVSRFDLRVVIDASNLGRYKAEVDDVISQLAGHPKSGVRVTYGHLPGYAYRFSLNRPRGSAARVIVLFDEDVEYQFTCQSTPRHRLQIESACSLVLASLRRVPS